MDVDFIAWVWAKILGPLGGKHDTIAEALEFAQIIYKAHPRAGWAPIAVLAAKTAFEEFTVWNADFVRSRREKRLLAIQTSAIWSAFNYSIPMIAHGELTEQLANASKETVAATTDPDDRLLQFKARLANIRGYPALLSPVQI